MSFSDPRHPLWEVLRLAILVPLLLFVLWRNASNFDGTEWKAFAEYLVLYLLWLLGEGRLRRRFNGDHPNGGLTK